MAGVIRIRTRGPGSAVPRGIHPEGVPSMNNIVYIIGAVVIILAILSFIGLR